MIVYLKLIVYYNANILLLVFMNKFLQKLILDTIEPCTHKRICFLNIEASFGNPVTDYFLDTADFLLLSSE